MLAFIHSKTKYIALPVIFLFCISQPLFATSYTSSNYMVKDPVMDNGANKNTSPNYIEQESIGQDAQGVMQSTNYIIKTGFQYYDYGFSPPSITFTLSGTNINFGTLIPGNAPTTVSSGTTASVYTNAINGYSLLVQEDHDLANGPNGTGATIPALTNGGSPSTAMSWPSTTLPSSGTYGFGYSVSGSDTGSFNGVCSSNCFKQFSSSTQYMIAQTSSATNASGDSTNITYQVSIPNLQASGTYTNHILYSAVASY